MMNFGRNIVHRLTLPALILFLTLAASAQSPAPIPAFPLTQSGLVISRPVQPSQPFTVAGEHGILVGTQDGSFESWILPIKLLSHLTIEANLEGYSVPIPVNPQAANIEVRPDHTTITYSHAGFTIRQIMFSPQQDGSLPSTSVPATGPIVLFQIDAVRPMDLTFRFTPEMRWMWPRRNDGIPSPEWVPTTPQDAGVAEPGQATGEGYYILHLDYPDLAGAITIPTATPGILAPYQERPQVHPLELRLHYDPKRDGTGENAKYFPLLMAVATSAESATPAALHQALDQLNASIPAAYKAHATQHANLVSTSTSIETPDKSLNEAFEWGVVSIEQLKAHAYPTQETALVAGYYASADSARPGFGWFFGRDALYTLYAVNGFGDFALTRSELEFLIARQRPDGKIMHEYSQTAADPSVNWKSFPYMYAAADATPLFLMAVRDYLSASGDLAFLQSHKKAIEKAWAFETSASSDSDHDGIYDNSQGTGWVESWPSHMPHQEVYLALLDQQASTAYAAIETALGDPSKGGAAAARATQVHTKIEEEYYDPRKDCYAFSHNPDGTQDKSSTIYPSIAYWDTGSTLDHPKACLSQWAAPAIATDWGLRDVATTEPFYDGLSYHQGSVWPLFTSWGALAEYRASQPLSGQQMLMQNVDLTWAQDPGAVTELLSGDFFVPFGRSTSHQLWSSAMVITPTLRGLFGINLDAQTSTITVNPHLPADWNDAKVQNLHLGGQLVDLLFTRDKGNLIVAIREKSPGKQALHLRSDMPSAQTVAHAASYAAQISIPLPPVELRLPAHTLPVPGSRPGQIKVLSTKYSPNSVSVTIAGLPDTRTTLEFKRNQKVSPILAPVAGEDPQNKIATITESGKPDSKYIDLHFPQGQGWQTIELTLTW